MTTTLSVVIPTYNRRDSLRTTLAGLCKQTYPKPLFEVVVVSDGSTDGTAEMVAEFAKNSSVNLKFRQQENGGPSRARNLAVNSSSNEVIVFLDDDVEPVPEFLESHARWHEKDDRIAVIGPLSADSSRKDAEPPWITWEHEKLNRVYKMFQPGGQYPSGQGGPMHFYSGNASIRRNWLVETGGFDLRYTRQEDVELATRLGTEHHIKFMFDFDAVGLHRPSRTFQSWLKIPREYGRLDAKRVSDGTITYRSVSGHLNNRHPLSKVFRSIAAAGLLPALAVSALLRGLSILTSALGLRALAMICLSGLYNVTYWIAFDREYARLGPTSHAN